MIPVRYNLRSLLVRKSTTLATAAGIGLVIFVLASALMLSAGIRRTFASAGRDDHAIVMRRGADTELSSTIDLRMVGTVFGLPGVQRDPEGNALGAGEFVILVARDKSGAEGHVSNLQLRGISEASLKLRSEARVVAGRLARFGTDEVMIGKALVGRFSGMRVGEKFEVRKHRALNVVGVFDAGGSSLDSEVWADIDTVRSLFAREGLVSSMTVRLESAAAFEKFKHAVESDKRLELDANRETDYYSEQSSNTSTFVMVLGTIVSFFFSIGAIIGAVITMHVAVSKRQREIGTLLALGFSRSSILASFLLESLVLAAVGGVIGLVAALAMSSVEISMLNFATWQEVTFRFALTPTVLGAALGFGCGMGVLGGFFPAVRAARLRPIDALRASR